MVIMMAGAGTLVNAIEDAIRDRSPRLHAAAIATMAAGTTMMEMEMTIAVEAQEAVQVRFMGTSKAAVLWGFHFSSDVFFLPL